MATVELDVSILSHVFGKNIFLQGKHNRLMLVWLGVGISALKGYDVTEKELISDKIQSPKLLLTP
jgi:hypothetical protein